MESGLQHLFLIFVKNLRIDKRLKRGGTYLAKISSK